LVAEDRALDSLRHAGRRLPARIDLLDKAGISGRAYPRQPKPCLFSPRSSRPRGLREASCGRGGCGVHGGRPSRVGRHGGASSPGSTTTRSVRDATRDDGTEENRARGEVAAVGAASTFPTSTPTPARSRRLRRHHRPAHPLGSASRPEKPAA
jgi:hypothetical protein